MLNRTHLRRPLPALAVGVLALALVGGGTAVAADFVTSRDVKDDSLRSADVKDGSLRVKDLSDAAVLAFQQRGIRSFTGAVGAGGAQGVTGATGAQGTKGDAGTAGAKGDKGDKGDGATYAGPNWSIVDRNVLGNGDSYLRAGPGTAPLGQGSLGMRTGSPTDAASFGNQVDFSGQLVRNLTHLSYSVFTTRENNGRAPNNMPGVKLEIDPNIGSTNYTTLVYAPDNSTASQWTSIDAVADTGKHWGFTGGFFNDPATMNDRCGINGARCTFGEIQALLAAQNDAAQGPAEVTFSIAIGKGRDYAFSGAVDTLRINNQVFDFEPFGVYTSTP